MLEGVYPAIITPFSQDGDPNLKSLEYNLRKWNDTNISGYLVLGSTGEFVYMDEEEKLEVVKKVIQKSDDKQIIAGTGCESTEETIDLTNKVADLGADASLIIPPHYYSEGSMTDKVLKNHFVSVANQTDIPIILYNMPKYTDINLSKDLVSNLSKHRNIVGIKDSSGDLSRIGNYIRETSNDFDVMVGTANILLGGLVLGASGGILALANLAPNKCCQIYNEFQEGNLGVARDLQLTVQPINDAVTSKYGIKGLKAAMEMRGYRGGYCKPPLKNYELTCQEEGELEDLIRKIE